MSKEVSNIFKILIGTIVLIVVASAITEMVNISMYGIQLQQIVRTSCDKAATLFAQETYKKESDESGLVGKSCNMPAVVASDGSSYIEGNFYSGETVEEIYNSLYTKPEFSDWVATYGENWKSVSTLNRYLTDEAFRNTPLPVYNPSMTDEEYDALVETYTEAQVGKSYVDTYVTPLNFGVPYIDFETLNKMFKWNLAQMVSNCNSNSIVPSEVDGTMVIKKNGFEILADQATVTKLDYKVYHLEDDASERKEFIEITHIDPDNLGFEDSIEYLGTDEDERQNICVIGIEYSVPIRYVGITPLKRIFNYVWTTEVAGYDGVVEDNRTEQEFNSPTADLIGGGFEGNKALEGVLPVPGKLIFYLVR